MTERVPVKRKITVGGKRIHGRRVHARLGYVETAHLKHFGLAPPDSKIQRHSVFAIFHKGRPLFSRVVDVKELDHIDEATGLKPYPDSESYRIDVGTRIRHLMSLLK